MQVQDVSKRGLKYGDEEEDEAEAAEFEVSKKAFLPLLEWLKKQLAGRVSDGAFLSVARFTSPLGS
jgi:heat shock protein beta